MSMSTIELDGIRVDYEIVGAGAARRSCCRTPDPSSAVYRPLVGALAGRPVLHYRRETPEDPTHGIEDDARLCVRLLAHLGIDRPHVVGHSYGGLVALELARGWPGDIRSIALLEPAPSGLLPPAEAAARMTGLAELARSRGPAAAMDQFLRAVGGPDGPETLERLVPGAVPDALAHAAGFFAVELPAAVRWSFDSGRRPPGHAARRAPARRRELAALRRGSPDPRGVVPGGGAARAPGGEPPAARPAAGRHRRAARAVLAVDRRGLTDRHGRRAAQPSGTPISRAARRGAR